MNEWCTRLNNEILRRKKLFARRQSFTFQIRIDKPAVVRNFENEGLIKVLFELERIEEEKNNPTTNNNFVYDIIVFRNRRKYYKLFNISIIGTFYSAV